MRFDWPRTATNDYIPWWTIIWRLCWWPLLIVGVALLTVGIFMMYGPYDAANTWRQSWRRH